MSETHVCFCGICSNRVVELTHGLDKARRELLSMKQSLQRGVQPHELSDQIIRSESEAREVLERRIS